MKIDRFSDDDALINCPVVNPKDLEVGDRHFKWTIIEKFPANGARTRPRYIMRCECGTISKKMRATDIEAIRSTQCERCRKKNKHRIHCDQHFYEHLKRQENE